MEELINKVQNWAKEKGLNDPEKQYLKESWLPVIGFEGIYVVSDKGRVKSVDRICTHKNGKQFRYKGKMLSGYYNIGGYHAVDLYRNSRRTHKLVHNLVMDSFVGVKPKGMDVNHINGNKEDNTLSNLEYCTRSENMIHAFKTGLCKKTRAKQKLGVNSTRVLVLNTETGIYYDSIREASKAHCINHNTLNQRIIGTSPTYTPMIRV